MARGYARAVSRPGYGAEPHDPAQAVRGAGACDRPVALGGDQGNVVAASTYSRMLRREAGVGLAHRTGGQSPSACRRYDLRHAGDSLRLIAGVPTPGVAE